MTDDSLSNPYVLQDAIIDSKPWRTYMGSLIVRGVDDTLIQSLREQAAANGRSAEAEHRDILARALLQPARRSLAEVLAAMPDVGQDADFARHEDSDGAAHVFG